MLSDAVEMMSGALSEAGDWKELMQQPTQHGNGSRIEHISSRPGHSNTLKEAR